MNSHFFFQMTRHTDISDYGHAVRIARFGGCKTSLDAIKVSGVPRPKAIRPRYWTAAGRIYNYTKPRLPPESRVPKHVHTNIHKAVSVGPVFSENDESDNACAPTDLTKERCVDSRPHRIQLFHQVFPSRPHLSRPLARISIPVSHFPQGRGEGRRGPSNEGVRRDGR